MIDTFDAALGVIQPEDVASPILVPARWRNGLEDGDRITFDVVDGQAVNVGIIRCVPRLQLRDWAR